MDSEQKQMLEKLLEITEQNNQILRSMKRHMFWSKVFSILYWAVIIGLTIWSLSLIQPYLGMLTGLTDKAQQIQNIDIKSLLK